VRMIDGNGKMMYSHDYIYLQQKKRASDKKRRSD